MKITDAVVGKLAEEMPKWRFTKPGDGLSMASSIFGLRTVGFKEVLDDLRIGASKSYEAIITGDSTVYTEWINYRFYAYRRILNISSRVLIQLGDPVTVTIDIGSIFHYDNDHKKIYEFHLCDPDVFDKMISTMNETFWERFWHINTFGLSTLLKKLFRRS